MRGVLSALALLFQAIPAPSYACGICIDFPEATVADHLLSAEAIVVASPAQDNPYVFEIESVIAGDLTSLANAPEIPFLVGSSLRRSFQSGKPARVLMSFGPGRAPGRTSSDASSWRRHFMANPDRLDFVSAALAAGDEWNSGMTTSHERAGFFAQYLEYADPVLRDIALIELDRAPYELFRAHAEAPPFVDMHKNFTRLENIAFVPISIRMLGIDQSTEARKYLRQNYPAAIRNGSRNARHWATAGLEADPEIAFSIINERLRSAMRDGDRGALILALRDAGTVHQHLRSSIAKSFRLSLEQSDEGLEDLAIAVYEWGDTSLNSIFEEMLERGDLSAMSEYVLRAVLVTES